MTDMIACACCGELAPVSALELSFRLPDDVFQLSKTEQDARCRLSSEYEIVIVAGAPIESASGLHIGALCFSPHRPAVTYSKRYLHEGEEKTFAPGVGGEPLSIHDRVVGIAICAEITHPEHAAETACRGADIYAASCFITPGGYAHDTALLAKYAREHRMMVLMANFGTGNGTWM